MAKTQIILSNNQQDVSGILAFNSENHRPDYPHIVNLFGIKLP